MMRMALTHHLQMIDDITKNSPLREIVRDSTLHLLVLHLPAIRYSMSKNSFIHVSTKKQKQCYQTL